MTMKKILPVSLFAMAMMSAVSCAGPRYGAGVGVRFGPPPPPRYGAVGLASGPGYVWTDGYWNRGSREWEWMAGSWQRPPRARAKWVPGRWQAHRGGYRFQRGRWR
jgi:hypothetical protein